MKDSGVEWIGKIPEDWETQNLKSILAERKENNNPIKTGFILSLTNDRGVIPYTEKGDIGNKSKDDLTAYKLAYPGDIVLNSMNVIIGSVGLSDYFGLVSPIYYMLYSRNQKDSIKYYNYIFQTKIFQNNLKGYGNGILAHRMRIPMIKLNTVMLTYPPYKVQETISNFLDQKVAEIDHTIDKTKLSIEEYKKYKQSLITETVTKGLNSDVKMKDSGIEWIGEIPDHWKVTRPNRVCEIIRGNSGFQKDDMKDEGDYVAIQYGQIYKVDEVNETFKYYIDESFYKSNQLVQKDDTILVSTSETLEDLGHSCFYNRHDYGLLGGEQMCLKPNELNIVGKFLYYATTYFRYELNRYATGLKVFRFRLDDLKKVSIVIPPIDEQNRIINFLDKKILLIDNVVLCKESLLIELESYKKSLIFECVTGKREVI